MASSSTANPTGNDVALAIASLANETVLGDNTITSTAASSATTPLGLTGHMAIDGVPITVGVGDSLSTIMTNINAVTGQTGVTASITQSSAGYQLVLTASSSSGNISVANGDLDTSSQSLLQTLTTNPVNAGTAMNLTGTIQLGAGNGGNEYSVSVQPTDTLTDVMTNIDNINALDNTGVVASLSTNGSGNSVLVLTKGSQISIPSGTITGTIGLAGATYADYEAGVVANIGQATKTATNLSTYNQNMLTSLQQQQSQESGVSIDDEMSNLIKFQNAYQAAASIYTTAETLMNSLLEAVGITT